MESLVIGPYLVISEFTNSKTSEAWSNDFWRNNLVTLVSAVKKNDDGWLKSSHDTQDPTDAEVRAQI